MPESTQIFSPSRLSIARKRRGLTKSELALAVGVDLRSVTAYEAGEYPPRIETAEQIARSLEFPLEFFYGSDLDEPTPDSASFRALSKMTATQRDMALSQGAIALHFNNWLDHHFDLPASNLPDLSREPSP
ncbi:MAG TPA: helix-turn-helix transcriptional regulator, partial [Chthoniobacterales bacterium]|nr:helix-turn-helix transcriptional regulator [Chthoniobacterales bacterium]